MTPEQLLEVAKVAMQRVEDKTCARYALFVHKGELLCTPSLLAPIECIRVATLTHDQLIKGLTPSEWTKLSHNLYNVWKELKL